MSAAQTPSTSNPSSAPASKAPAVAKATSGKSEGAKETAVAAMGSVPAAVASRLTPEMEKSLALAVSSIEKSFGKGAIMRLGTKANLQEIESIGTGSIGLDAALGIGGLPRGRIVEIFGPESSGKTTLTLQVVAEAQRKGGTAAFIDAEHALDISYARKLGVKVEDLLVSQPDTGEQALEICDVLIRSGALDVIVIDSVAALTPRAEIEGEMGDSHMGLQARLMSQALRKLTGTISKSKTLVIFINQLRMKIGVMFGNPETTTGGNALKFYSSVRLDIRRIGSLKTGEDVIGARTRVKVVKNKVAPPFKQVEFDILYGKGVSSLGEIIDYGTAFDIIEKSGSWYSFGGERIGQGRDNAKNFLEGNPEMLEKVKLKVTERLKSGQADALLSTTSSTTGDDDVGSSDALILPKSLPISAKSGTT